MLESKYFSLLCVLSLINVMCCRAEANINSLRLRRRELMFRNLPSNAMTLIGDNTR